MTSEKDLVIVVSGSRDWNDKEAVFDELMVFPRGTVLAHGDCRGLDRIAGAIGTKFGFVVHARPADWDKHGNAAGMIRNGQMLAEFEPDLVICFHDDIRSSRGTKDMLNKAVAGGYPVRLIPSRAARALKKQSRERAAALVGPT